MTRADRATRRATPVTIRGRRYPSVQNAAALLEVSEMTIYRHMRRGTLDEVGWNSVGGGRPVSIDGITYPSISQAARALGIARHKLRDALKSEAEI